MAKDNEKREKKDIPSSLLKRKLSVLEQVIQEIHLLS